MDFPDFTVLECFFLNRLDEGMTHGLKPRLKHTRIMVSMMLGTWFNFSFSHFEFQASMILFHLFPTIFGMMISDGFILNGLVAPEFAGNHEMSWETTLLFPGFRLSQQNQSIETLVTISNLNMLGFFHFPHGFPMGKPHGFLRSALLGRRSAWIAEPSS